MDKNVSSPLGTAPVGRLMLKMALPTVVAQLVNLLYNIVDRVFIGHMEGIGADAFTIKISGIQRPTPVNASAPIPSI